MTASSQTLSVALATFNGGRFLAQQLESLAAQTLQPLELVIVDDGSTDETFGIIDRFVVSAPFPVRVFRNERRLGYRLNFMRAAELCSGDLICFCDQDDVWADGKLARVAAEFHDQEVLLVYHNARLIDANGKSQGYVFKRGEKNAILSHEDVEPWRIVPGFSQSIRRSLLRYSGLHLDSVDMFSLDDPMPHDQWFLFLASALGKTSYIAEELAFYRQHDRNTSGWLPAKPLAYALHNIAYASYYVRSSHRALLSRIELLRKLKSLLPAAKAGDIDAVITHYQHVIEYVRRRLTLYTEKSVRVRARLLLSMIRNRTYASDKVRFGRGSLLLDTIIGVPVGHTLR
jgi:glycosyltransferase involved in cell wall biosynthesis